MSCTTYTRITGVGVDILDTYGLLDLTGGTANQTISLDATGSFFEFRPFTLSNTAAYFPMRTYFGDIQLNSWVSISNPDKTSTYPAFWVKHGDGLGNHQDIVKVTDDTGIFDYLKVGYTGKTTMTDAVMVSGLITDYLFSGLSLLTIRDAGSGSGILLETAFTEPGVPADGTIMFANPFGAAVSFVDSNGNYFAFQPTNAGTSYLSATYIGFSDYSAAGQIYQIVGEYNQQPCINKRLGTSVNAVTSPAVVTQLGTTSIGGALINGSTVTTIQGIIAPDSTYTSTGRNGSRFMVMNRSTLDVTFEHDSSGATAADRMYLPNSKSVTIPPYGMAEFAYSTGHSRWYMLSATPGTSINTSGISTFTGTSITQTSETNRILTYTGSSSQVFSATGFGTLTNLKDGTKFTIIGTSNTNTIRFNNTDATDGYLLHGDQILGYGDTLVLVYVSGISRLVQIGGSV